MGALLPVRHAGHVSAFLGPREGKKERFPSDHHPCHSPQHPQPICYDWMDAMLHTEGDLIGYEAQVGPGN
ncbi:hypothetical protein BDA96_04G259500 [Sorghum bicolor]|uniref:Uncharacterized protein n=1 Tax=Sorghum bicolor TaxID=4558 RepID=A0A921R5D7_SORBI|nr:hypothetical protein BDA96_04G259500 [Sorghum bicolor]